MLTTRQSYQPNWLVDIVDDAIEFLTGHSADLVAAPVDIPVGRPRSFATRSEIPS